ncbi:Coproporphyrin III ferrochelatase [Dirofilaria immitis]
MINDYLIVEGRKNHSELRMWYSWIIIIALINYTLFITACKIKIKMQSRTDHPFQLQIYVPAIKMKSQRLTFNERDDMRIITIKGDRCDRKHWIFKTWKKKGKKWIPAKESKAKIEGIGSFGLSIPDDLMPRMENSFAIICSEGNCSI